MTNPTPAFAQDLLTAMIRTPSVSGAESDVAALIASAMGELGLPYRFVGRNLLVEIKRGAGPTLMFNSHMDTVPANPGYTRDPMAPSIEDGRLYGLGSNDAGGCVVSMICAAAQVAARDDWQGTLQVSIVVEEEVTGINGAEALMREIPMPDAAIVGEPTALDICIAQKGLVIFDCVNTGLACHAANAWRVEHKNALLEAAADVLKVPNISFEKRDEFLGPTTLNVTVLKSGVATNSIPDQATWSVDARVNPAQTLQEVYDTLQEAVDAAVKPRRALRLHPMRTPNDASIVRAAHETRPEATIYGSDTMSDMVFFRSTEAIKCGPGHTEMSHKPDEYLDLSWLPRSIDFYRDTALRWFALRA